MLERFPIERIYAAKYEVGKDGHPEVRFRPFSKVPCVFPPCQFGQLEVLKRGVSATAPRHVLAARAAPERPPGLGQFSSGLLLPDCPDLTLWGGD